jgi:glycyl-tRNA synthetase beta chain
VIAGNERVVRPRLADALFFWQQDLKQGFVTYVNKLETVTYQKDLGSLLKKVQRVDEIALPIMQALSESTTHFEHAVVRTAINLCKNDLATKMVYEFPELQGIMGGYYAEKSGESTAVANAIREHYLPTQQGTPIPSTREGQIIALADKLDTLAGIFAIGQKPTASKDPFALRRAALGALRICIEGKLPLDITALLKSALEAQPVGKRDAATLAELTNFIFERFTNLCSSRLFEISRENDLALHGQGKEVTDFPVVEIVEAVRVKGAIPLDLMSRAEALLKFLYLPQAVSLAAAHKRVRNILKQAGDSGGSNVNAKLFAHDSEKALFAKMTELEKLNAKADYDTKLTNLATLREPVDAFFDGVMVNDKDAAVRNNRLALLRQLDALCREVADISLLPG